MQGMDCIKGKGNKDNKDNTGNDRKTILFWQLVIKVDEAT